MPWTVAQIARMTGVSVRTLHHYDELGLLRPSGRNPAGYRLYGPSDVERLQQVLFFRELGFSLEHIGRILDEPGFDAIRALREQRAALVERLGRLHGLIASVDAAIERARAGEPLEEEVAMREAFEGFDHAKYEAEVEARWGDTDAFRESRRRMKGYGKEDVARIREESAAIFQALAELMARGVPPTDPEATEAAERHRLHIERWFYPCPPAMHSALGEMYAVDARFGDGLERIHEGLTAYVREAFAANAGAWRDANRPHSVQRR